MEGYEVHMQGGDATANQVRYRTSRPPLLLDAPPTRRVYRYGDVTLEPVTEANLYHVVRDMRASDREEIACTTILPPDDDMLAFRQRVMLGAGAMTWCACHTGTPALIVGTWAQWPGVWIAFAFGTPAAPRVMRGVSKHIRKFIIPALLRAGVHRVEARALASHTTSHRWLMRHGAVYEATLKGYGAQGQDFVVLRWDRDSVQSPKHARHQLSD